ncbi:sugar ABC transporter ATP-binding protein [Pseudonocardia kunmingensis]|uniref:sugar ABC transporter ATP-binding protein n=1 Tax=Pseudonocardia kunmingensis TaxID=630975 RepID=UPI001151E161|nr:sugar ABC transporter ATP-binding protein [Pseudonocardia kunmingensis]
MATTTSGTVLAARGISRRFGGVQALDGVSLDIRAGDVRCLAGENGCGKSTLIKILSGVEVPDAGEIEIGGTTRSRMNPADALRAGIQVIYQDFSLFPNLTVAENIALAPLIANRRKLVDPRRLRARAAAVVAELGVRLDLDATVEELTVADRQLTAICRALAEEARVLFMDEPTTALTQREVRALFRVVETLRERGVATVFVSHKLDEVLEISRHVTVMRNGAVVASGRVEEFDRNSLGRAMTGRDVRDQRDAPPFDETARPVLRVEGLGLDGAFEDVSFDVAPGEILGITGLLGSGRSEIAEALFGVTPAQRGRVEVGGAQVAIRGIDDAVAAGIGYVPSDRLTEGLFLEQSIADNVVAGSLDLHRSRSGLLDRARLARTIDTFFAALRIKAPSVAAPIRSLSGGNQQRVVLAKWLARAPRVLVLNSPTVGVDVGSKEEILDILRREAGTGTGVIVVSDDIPELVSVCHRVLVVRRGRIHEVIDGERVTEDSILEGLSS